MAADRTLTTANAEEIVVTRHAFERFRERGKVVFVAGQLDGEDGSWELLRGLFRRSGMQKRRPGWLYGTRELKHSLLTVGFIIVRKALAFPVERSRGRLITTTCIARDR